MDSRLSELTEIPKKDYCWMQMRGRYRAKGDPRFYYAPKGHTFETAHDAKPAPKKTPKRTIFPTLEELPSINYWQLYKEMKPESSGRNAFKRKWKRWIQSIRDQKKAQKRKEEIKRSKEEKKRVKRETLERLQREWEARLPHLKLPPSMSTYLQNTAA